MKQKSFKFVGGILLVALAAVLVAGCGTTWRVEYENPQYGGAAVQFTLPKKGGYTK